MAYYLSREDGIGHPHRARGCALYFSSHDERRPKNNNPKVRRWFWNACLLITSQQDVFPFKLKSPHSIAPRLLTHLSHLDSIIEQKKNCVSHFSVGLPVCLLSLVYHHRLIFWSSQASERSRPTCYVFCNHSSNKHDHSCFAARILNARSLGEYVSPKSTRHHALGSRRAPGN